MAFGGQAGKLPVVVSFFQPSVLPLFDSHVKQVNTVSSSTQLSIINISPRVQQCYPG